MREISRMSKTLATLRKWSVFSALTTPQQWLLSSEVRDRQWVPNRICHQPQGGSETAPQRPHRLQQSASLSLHQFFSQFVQMSNLLTTWRHASLSLITNILVSHCLSFHFEPCTLLCPNSMHLAQLWLFESPAKFCWMAQHSRFGSENRASQNFMDHHGSSIFPTCFFFLRYTGMPMHAPFSDTPIPLQM